MKVKNWNPLPFDNETAQALQQSLGIHPVLCELLVQRGITSFNEAKNFFRPSLTKLHDPFLMADLEKAADRIIRAIGKNEFILLYGDYDVDGTTCVTMMSEFLSRMGARIEYYIPDRHKEGYGVSSQGIEYSIQMGFDLIVAMDCGIKANDQIGKAQAAGIDFIVCDHHIPGLSLPPAFAVLDPKREDCGYPYKELSGCGVVFKLIQGICEKMNLSLEAHEDLLDLLVISIACDIVPITGENRILAYFGLERLANTERIGLKALIKESGRMNRLRVSDIVFGIGPMINAAGRLGDAKEVVKLLLSQDENYATTQARVLKEQNELRKEYDKTLLEEAKEMFSSTPDFEDRMSIVLHQEHWHKGIVGIAAARMVDHFYRPTIILTTTEGKVVGSARSVKGFDIYEAIDQCSDLLSNYGGHAFAAGLTLKENNVLAFQERFESMVSDMISEEQLIPKISISSILKFEDLTPKFWRILRQFAPFGPGNRNPVFRSDAVVDSGFSKIVKEDHIKLSLKQDVHNKMDGIGFGLSAKKHLLPSLMDVCYTLEENEWNGRTSLQLNVKDIKANKQ